MKNMSFNATAMFSILAEKYISYKREGLRKGQSVYSAAFSLFPEQVNSLTGTEFDCFYLDDRIEKFLEKLFDMI